MNYIDINLRDNTSIASDVDRYRDSFIRQFNGMYHKFKVLYMYVLHFLFISYCMLFYGIEVWYEKLESQKQYKRMSVLNHKAIKQMCV